MPELEQLWTEAATLWDRYEKSRGFDAYVPADYPMVYEELLKLRGHAINFLEWGSGLGVVTIMASRLGFDAYGLEISPELVEQAEQLAKKFGCQPKFAVGSFVPTQYEWDPQMGEDGLRTDFDAADGYDEIGMSLDDFELVYAYPWPDEHDVFQDIMKKHGAQNSLFMTFDVREGIAVRRNKKRVRRQS